MDTITFSFRNDFGYTLSNVTFFAIQTVLYTINYLDYWPGARYFQPLWNPDILEILIPDPKTNKDSKSGETKPGKSPQPK